jgi:hypothetical protein
MLGKSSESVHVLGNCQVGGLTASLRLLVPNVRFSRKLISGERKELKRELIKHSKRKLLIQDSVLRIVNSDETLRGLLSEDYTVYPTITFSAFHPDTHYMFCNDRVIKNGLGSDWNSRILVYAYLNELTVGESLQLFNKESFRNLGYFDEWSKSSEELRRTFEDCSFDYGQWIRGVQRSGQFMYGINHPMPVGLTHLAQQIADREFSSSSSLVNQVNVEPKDYLSHIVWPLYPEIAEEFGMQGDYNWRVGRKTANLQEFVQRCFNSWDHLGLRSLEIKYVPDSTVRDNLVLQPFLDGTNGSKPI